MRFSSQTIRGHLPSILLAVLEHEPLYGYRIAQAVEEKSAGLLHLGQGTIYPALYALEAKGLVKAEWRESDSGPKRRYYALTERGHKALARDRASFARFAEALDTLLANGGGRKATT
ncbi:MAG: helix-turn-helix transcriptional regulator [Planctomycetes bacterium]|nr:helix-turn-helix transcriptional regulator [Planctomycetota bacterium]